MKIGIAETEGRRFLAVRVNDETADLSSVMPAADVQRVIEGGVSLLQQVEAALPSVPRVSQARWCAPLSRPPKFLLLAGNFRAHVVESGFEAAPEKNLTPQFFVKPSSTILDPEQAIPLTKENVSLDYESEIAVVIGKRIKDVSVDDALSGVWGYTVVNDISERKLNGRMDPREMRSNDQFFDWLVGKWFDGSAPMGPWITTADEMAQLAPSDVTVCARLNGQEVQRAPITSMIHSIAEAIAYISRLLTLETGDVISMGTPAGVGLGRGVFLQDGDVIECEVSGIGVLRNTVEQVRD